MRVLSLFDGVSCGRIALERAGIPVDIYYASEIEKQAIQITQKNWPETIQLGDVTQIDFAQFKGEIDLIIGGSPCTNMSIAKQNREGLRGEQSKLFWNFVDALDIIRPKYFLLENVASMSKDDKDAITDALKNIFPTTECIMINSALVSAQNRKRLYWTNIPGVCQPDDKGILLKDIIHENASADRDKSHAIIASIGRTTPREYFKKNQGQLVFEKQDHAIHRVGGFYGQVTRWGVYDTNAKAPTLTASMGMGGGHVPMIVSRAGALNYQIKVKDKKVIESQNIKQGLSDINLPDGTYTVRKLTPVETERCQTLPDNYTELGIKEDGSIVKISASARYKAIGNGWTVDVISHIFKGLK